MGLYFKKAKIKLYFPVDSRLASSHSPVPGEEAPEEEAAPEGIPASPVWRVQVAQTSDPWTALHSQ